MLQQPHLVAGSLAALLVPPEKEVRHAQTEKRQQCLTGNGGSNCSQVENSGLSQAAFCRRERIPEWKLSEWKRRVGKASAQSVRTERPVHFAPVTVVAANSEARETTPGSTATAKLPALDVIVIRLPVGASISAFQQIVQVVTAKC